MVCSGTPIYQQIIILNLKNKKPLCPGARGVWGKNPEQLSFVHNDLLHNLFAGLPVHYPEAVHAG